MGNIKSLQRKSGGTLKDNLVYTYKNGVNSYTLFAVSVNSGDAGGFNDINKSGDNYAYCWNKRLMAG